MSRRGDPGRIGLRAEVPIATARDHLAVALDVPGLEEARRLLGALAGVPGWVKVGAELFGAAGPEAVDLAASTARVFLDTKLHDIPRTVAAAVSAATRRGVGMLTLHASGGASMLRAAREAADEAAAATGARAPLLVAVTVLTSFGEAELKEVGTPDGVEAQVSRLAELALGCGLDGLVSSAREASTLRAQFGSDFLLVTPGIRSASDPHDDQRRTALAAEAIAAGADLLVVGRPILRAADPARAARAIIAEIEQSLAARSR